MEDAAAGGSGVVLRRAASSSWLLAFSEVPSSDISKPIAAISDPPAGKRNWNSGGQRPPDGQDEICDQPKDSEADPEDFLLHGTILVAVMLFFFHLSVY